MTRRQTSEATQHATVAAKLKVERVAIGSLRPWPGNPRLMPPQEMESLKRSISQWGMVEPIVVRRADRMVIGGHQRLEAARAMGLRKVPVVYVDLDENEARLLNIALNKIHGEWDLPKLGALLDELRDLPDLDVTLSGFDGEEMDRLLAELERNQRSEEEERFDAEQAMAEAEQATGPTRVQPGDVWELGPHRLLCGDATEAASWERLMDGQQAAAVVTDPPYGINYVGGRAAQETRIARARRGVDAPSDAYWDDLSPEQYRTLLKASLCLAHQHSDSKAPLYLWFASTHLRDVLACLEEAGWQERTLLVWVKNNGAGALFAQYKFWYEPFFYAFKQGKTPRWRGPSNESTVWQHDKPARNPLHPTMKPVELIERQISNSTAPRQLVVDPFLGSGTAIIAAQRTGRICFGMDREPRYCDVILDRWTALGGREPVRVGAPRRRDAQGGRRPARAAEVTAP
jgi:DNA modification methylase